MYYHYNSSLTEQFYTYYYMMGYIALLQGWRSRHIQWRSHIPKWWGSDKKHSPWKLCQCPPIRDCADSETSDRSSQWARYSKHIFPCITTHITCKTMLNLHQSQWYIQEQFLYCKSPGILIDMGSNPLMLLTRMVFEAHNRAPNSMCKAHTALQGQGFKSYPGRNSPLTSSRRVRQEHGKRSTALTTP